MSSTRTGRRSRAVPLDQDDPRILAARQAERRLYGYYGLEPAHHLVALPRLGLRVRLTEVGSGPPVLVVPGNTGDGFPFAPLLPHLPGRRVIVLNRPGGGLSEGMDHTTIGFRDLARYTLSTVLDSLGIDRVPVIAHSMGGHWSQWFAMDRPDRVTALALLGVPGNVLTTQPPLALRLASVRGLNRPVVRATIPRRTQDALKGLGFLGHSPQTLKRLPAALAECYFTFDRLPNYQMSTRTLMEVTNRLRGSNPRIRITEAELATVRAPTALLWASTTLSATSKPGNASPRSCSKAGSRSSPGVATCRGSTTLRRPGGWSWTSCAPSTSEGHAVSTTPEPADQRGECPETAGPVTEAGHQVNRAPAAPAPAPRSVPGRGLHRPSTWTTLGTMGGPIASSHRAQPANLLMQDGFGALLADSGDGAADQLAKAGVDLAAVGAVILSHLHIDHTAGLYGILGRRLQQRIPGELRIYGPPGTRQVVEQITASQTYLDDLMKTDAAAGSLAPATVTVTEVTEGSVVTARGAAITATTNSDYGFHDGTAEADRFQSLSYRFDLPGRSIPGPARTSCVSPPAPTSW